MTLSEKSAYLKGLMEGMKLNTESDEGKMIAAIVDLLGDVTRTLTDVEETTIAISDELDEIEEDLDAIEDYILDEDDEEEYDDLDFDEDEDDDLFFPDEDEDEDDEDGEDQEAGAEGFDFGDPDTTVYEVVCSCGNVIDFDEQTLERGSIKCPECGELLEFTTDEEDEE